MMYKLLTIMIITTSQVSGKFLFPDNADFTINYFNSSTCGTNTTTKNSTMKSLCLDTQIEGGFPKCCNTLLQEVGIVKNTTFDKCYSYTTVNSTITGVMYHCELTNLKGITIAETFSYIGALLLAALLLTLMCGCVIKCIKRKNSYDRL
jgi:hypothetical protein